MEGRLSSGHADLALIWLQGGISRVFPVAAVRRRRPASRGQGWGRKAPPRRGFGLDGGEDDVSVLRAMGETGIGEDRGGIEVEVSVSFRDAWSRLICAGWLPQDRVFGWERSAGLRTSVARAPRGRHWLLIASGRVAPRAATSMIRSLHGRLGAGGFSRAAPPATSTSRQVRGRQRRWRSPLVSCAGSIQPSGHASAGCRHGHGHGPRPGPDPNGAEVPLRAGRCCGGARRLPPAAAARGCYRSW
jgi:hypothetical protein